jgi:ABC-type multidrug transport system ATPase subunit
MDIEETNPPAVYVSNVSVSTGRAHHLRNFSIELSEGDFAIVLGASGSGKSVLIRTLAGEIRPSSGQVLLGGHPAETLAGSLPLSIAYLNAFPRFPQHLSPKELLRYAAELRLPHSVPKSIREKWLCEIIKLTGTLPFLDKKICRLNAVQLCRLSLAEALVGDPVFMFLDEITRGLDPHADYEITKCLKTLASVHRKTIVFSTQQVKSLSLCNTLLFLHEGKCTFRGTFDELWATHRTQSTRNLYGFYHEASVTGRAPALKYAPSLGPAPKPRSLHSCKPPDLLWRMRVLVRRAFQNWFQRYHSLCSKANR